MKYVFIVIAIAALSSCNRTTKTEVGSADSLKITGESLPDITFFATNGDTIRFAATKERKVLILFTPDCDHCQREATEISQHPELFKDYKLIFVAADQLPVIKNFAVKYGLSNWANAVFARGEIMPVVSTFKPTSMPAILIYNDDGFLVKRFDGETPILNIVEFL